MRCHGTESSNVLHAVYSMPSPVCDALVISTVHAPDCVDCAVYLINEVQLHATNVLSNVVQCAEMLQDGHIIFPEASQVALSWIMAATWSGVDINLWAIGGTPAGGEQVGAAALLPTAHC
jgi:hypothetical protein